jgi:glycosyltransferase involved in cell wall biosynthesis
LSADGQGWRVLQVLQPEDGGVAQHVLDLSLALAERGWEVEVAAPPRCTALPRLRAAGVPVHPLPLVRAPGAADLRALRALRGLDRARRYSLVHAHSSKAGAIARAGLGPARRLVYTPHCFAFASEDFSASRRAGYRLIEQALLPRTAAVVAVSEWEAELCRRLVGGSGRVELIRNGTHACREMPPDAELVAWKGGHPLAALVSKLRPQKDPLALVHAAAALQRRGELPGRVAVVGDGELLPAVRTEIERLGVPEHVRWFPFKGDSARYLAAIDLLVMPSRWESLPIGLIEAMACGVPVLATAVGGVPELVRNGVTGRLVPPGDARSLEQALSELLARPSERASLGAAARAYAERRLGLDAMVEATVALYDRLLEHGLGVEASTTRVSGT